jgi:hypothetical protein
MKISRNVRKHRALTTVSGHRKRDNKAVGVSYMEKQFKK